MGQGDQAESGICRGTLTRVVSCLRPVVVVGLLLLLFWLVPVKEVADHLRRVRLAPLAVAFFIMFATIVVSSLKLRVLVRTAHPEARLLGVLRAYYVGTFFNNFLPTSIGGDLLKINEMRMQGIPVRHGTASVVVERGTGVMILLALGAVVALGWGRLFNVLDLRPVRWPLAAATVGFFALLAGLCVFWVRGVKAFLKARSDRRILGRVYWVIESFYVFRNRPRAMLWACVLSALFYILAAASVVLVVHAVRADLGLAEAVGIMPIMKLPEMLPSIGALGVREGAITYCLARLGPTAAQAAAAALLLRFLTWFHSAIGGCVYALGERRAARPDS